MSSSHQNDRNFAKHHFSTSGPAQFSGPPALMFVQQSDARQRRLRHFRKSQIRLTEQMLQPQAARKREWHYSNLSGTHVWLCY